MLIAASAEMKHDVQDVHDVQESVMSNLSNSFDR